MAKRAYIGVDNIARNVKKMYVGIDGIARKIKRGYIGVNGVARLFFSSGDLAYYGSSNLSGTRFGMSATTIGNYALFGGGIDAVRLSLGEGRLVDVVDVFNKSLTLIDTAPDLSEAKTSLTACTIGDYALFAGGRYTRNAGSGTTTKLIGTDTVDAYDISLTKKSVDSLEAPAYALALTVLGDYALIAGGIHYVSTVSGSTSSSTKVTTYDKSLTKGTAPDLKSAMHGKTYATTVGDYALFFGGMSGSSSIRYLTYYDKSLTRSWIYDWFIDYSRFSMAVTTIGDYALIAGGESYSNNAPSRILSTVICIDKSLTLSYAPELSVARELLTGITLGDYALFAGGVDSSDNIVATTDTYDKSLTHTITEPLRTSRSEFTATTLGDYVLIAGGLYGGETGEDEILQSSVEAYTLG